MDHMEITCDFWGRGMPGGDDIDAFEAPRIPTWEEGAARLRKAYERALATRATHQ